MLMRQIAAEEAEHGIRANAVGIGWVAPHDMDHYRAMLRNPSLATPTTQGEMLNVLLAQIMDIVRLQRPGTLQESGNVFAFLASDQASYITGQTILLDGGATL